MSNTSNTDLELTNEELAELLKLFAVKNMKRLDKTNQRPSDEEPSEQLVDKEK